MRSSETADRLLALLTERGVRLTHPQPGDVDQTWEILRRFAEERLDDVPSSEPGDEDDGLCAEYGVFESADGDQEFFELSIVRQMAVRGEGREQPDLVQLRCAFRYTLTDELRALGDDSLWSFDIGLDDFFAQALALSGFAWVRDNGDRPLEGEVRLVNTDEMFD